MSASLGRSDGVYEGYLLEAAAVEDGTEPDLSGSIADLFVDFRGRDAVEQGACRCFTSKFVM